MKNIKYFFLPILLCLAIYFSYSYGYFDNHNEVEKLEKNDLQLVQNLEKGIYYLHRKCNDYTKTCHILQPLKKDQSYYLDFSQKPVEERMYILINNQGNFIYSLTYYDEEMVPVITWAKMNRIDDEPFAYSIDENHTVVDMALEDSKFSFSKEARKGLVKIGDLTPGNIYKLKQKIVFIPQGNSEYTIDCRQYRESIENKNNIGVDYNEFFYTSCNNDAYTHYAKVDEPRTIYFQKIQ